MEDQVSVSLMQNIIFQKSLLKMLLKCLALILPAQKMGFQVKISVTRKIKW